ncbi:hypothetical protein ACMYMX_23395, partial [Salmonella enterica subsp. enterica serovar Enteritidis]|uniref:hypothetical protein n=1 Tax=Salmonella enterica TaxID=28901 RepID=UPI0039E8752A
AMSSRQARNDIANETQIRFVKSVEDRDLFYLVERRFNELIEWDVTVITEENEDEYYEDMLYLVAKEDYFEKTQ